MPSLEPPAAGPRLPDTIPELTSVRFFAAMFVVLFHIRDDSPLMANLPTMILTKGYLGVDIFFILSGFILTHVYLVQWREGRFRYGPFMLNRFARVYPLHLVMTLAFVALYTVSSRLGILATGEGMDWSALPFHLLAVHGWGFVGHHAWNFPSWSISSEFFAYLIFPLFLVLTRIGARAGLALAVIALTAAFYLCAWKFRPFTALTFDFGIIRIFFEFLLGVFIYMICAATVIGGTAARWLLLAAVAGFVAIAHFSVSNADDLSLIVLGGVVIYLLGQLSRAPGPSVMRAKPLVYLGEISYSTYMIHYMAQLVYVGAVSRLLGTPDGLPFWAWLGLIVTIMLGSVASFHLVEVPARNFIRRRLHERKPREWVA